MTIALIDDCPQDLALLSEYVYRYCNEHKIHVSIKQFLQEKEFESTLGTERYDLVFLDIFMQNSGGILIAKKLKRSNPKCQIIFSTSSEEHAVKAFRLHALDYLLKPYTYAQLEDALSHFENTIKFLWCYRNCLVNMDYIDTWESNDFILKNGDHLLISKSQKREIIQAYANYIFDYVNGGTIS